MIKKKTKKLVLLGLSLVLFFSVGIQTSFAAGSSAWVTYSMGSPYCKELPYGSYGTKPFTVQNYYQKKTSVNNAGKVTTSYRTHVKTLAAGCN